MTKLLKTIRIIFLTAILLMIVTTLFLVFNQKKQLVKTDTPISTTTTETPPIKSAPVYIGPRQNIPQGAPTDYIVSKKVGFWSFSVPVPGVLSRSGQPTYNDFKWLKENGWKSVVDTREDKEYGEVTDDQKIPGWNDLNFNYLYIPMVDNTAPTNEQAEKFLAFVSDPVNQPAHLHCRAGIGRTGTLTALYRYSVQGWSLTEALNETKLYGGINKIQTAWLEQWAKNHEPGKYSK